MADEKNHDIPVNEKESHSEAPSALEAGGELPPLRGWKYKRLTIFGYKFPFYASPQVQLVLVAFVCFMCPGMFNALNGMGGGGNEDHRAADDANCALYSAFAVIGFFAGTITNKLGIKFALSFGGLGYSVYVGSMLSFSHNQVYGFTVFAGFFLGVCAGILWCAQGAIMMSYPPEKSKGKYISWFWMIFNLGAVIGGLIPLGQNIHVHERKTVTDGTYIGFLVLTLVGAALAWLLVDAHNVVRDDGSKVILMKNPTWKTELLGLYETIIDEPFIILLFPMFFASNWFYTYHFNEINGTRFNTRTAALNNVLYYTMQIVGAFVFGYALDRPNIRRTVRAKAVWVVLFVLTFAIWGGGYKFAKSYTREDVKNDPSLLLDWTSHGYGGPLVLYMVYGMYDAAWQTTVYWYMGAMTNNGRKLANYAGFYKGIQSAGAAINWRLDSNGIPYMNEFASCWALLAGGLLFALPVILYKVKDTVELEEDLKFSDETVVDVAPNAERSASIKA
ncbi:uncharacterized protein PV09_01002 [Verruconis gallopava]|uniref:Major facilitator superfamily (MFS) profile domain-containing protein n=1 Tax=Verruconis gallopava TaxID=253628 RepID=A0A0D2ANJ3_9PEZI|nr:uncharacterized protein PV09_01002 [Verruconis gallopava]KIW08060.1 hypothetical protein PV09_01002 [Verruconis gallopava]